MKINFKSWLKITEAEEAAAAPAAPAAASTGSKGGSSSGNSGVGGGTPKLKPSDGAFSKGPAKNQDYIANDRAKSNASIEKRRKHAFWQSANYGCGGTSGKCASAAQTGAR